MRYTINWGKLINAYNKRHLGQITQSTLAKVFNVSGATISLDMKDKRTEYYLEKYQETYNHYFADIMPFEDILIKHTTF